MPKHGIMGQKDQRLQKVICSLFKWVSYANVSHLQECKWNGLFPLYVWRLELDIFMQIFIDDFANKTPCNRA